MKTKLTLSVLFLMALALGTSARTMYYCAPANPSVQVSEEGPGYNLRWMHNYGANCHVLTGYEIQVRTNHVTTEYYIAEQAGDPLSYLLSTVPGQVYQWRIRSIYAPGNGINRHSTWSRGPDINSTSEKMEPWGDESEINAIALFPNPAFENLSFEIITETPVAVSVDIFNSAGQKVQHNLFALEAGSSVTEFDVTTLEQGIYFVRISEGGKVRTTKIIKL